MDSGSLNRKWCPDEEFAAARQARDEVMERFFERLETEGGRTTVRAPSKTKDIGEVEAPAKVRVGLDYLKVWVYAVHDDPSRLMTELRQLQEHAKINSDGRLFTIAGTRHAEMLPHGAGVGTMRLPYMMRVSGAEMAFADLDKGDDKEDGRRLSMMIEFKGTYCYGRDGFSLCEEVHWWAQAFGFEDVETKVSRVDIYADRYDVPVQQAEVRRVLGGVVTRATRDRTERRNGKVTGLQYGQHGSPCRLTIYDKKHELSQRPEKAAVYYENYPDAKTAKHVTRYEFVLLREALINRHSISSLVDLVSSLKSLWRYLSTEWYREVDPDSDTRASRCEWETDWKYTVESGAAWLGKECKSERQRVPRERMQPKAEQLLRQAEGALATRAALLGLKPESQSELFACALKGSRERDKTIAEKVVDRFKVLRSRSLHWQEEISKKLIEFQRLLDMQKAAWQWERKLRELEAVPF